VRILQEPLLSVTRYGDTLITTRRPASSLLITDQVIRSITADNLRQRKLKVMRVRVCVASRHHGDVGDKSRSIRQKEVADNLQYILFHIQLQGNMSVL
jgi:hypothetical protein